MKRHTKIAGVALLTFTGATITAQAVAHDRNYERCHDASGYMGDPGNMPPSYWGERPWMNGPFGTPGYQDMPFRTHRHHMRMDGDYADILADRLDLTKDQRKAMEDVVKKTRNEMRDLWEERQDNRHDLHKMIRHGIEDQVAFDKLAENQGQLSTKLIKLRAELRTRVAKILDDDQRKRLNDEDFWYETW